MPKITRFGYLSAGHGCWPATRMIFTPTKKTYINNKLAGVIGSQYKSHTCNLITHPQPSRTIISGAKKTYIEGKLSARVGDPILCGDSVLQASPNTIIE